MFFLISKISLFGEVSQLDKSHPRFLLRNTQIHTSIIMCKLLNVATVLNIFPQGI